MDCASALPCFCREAAHDGLVAGVDEAGRGPLAGPVVAAAVILDRRSIPAGLSDSKLLPPDVRNLLAEELLRVAAVGIGVASVAEIDRLNILQATFLAMRRALAALAPAPTLVLVDGNLPPRDCDLPCRCVVEGDRLSLSIAAASIIAKVHRDRIMDELAARYPAYGWEQNRGYATPAHQAALAEHGPTEHHRRSFAPCRFSQSESSAQQSLGLGSFSAPEHQN